MKTITWACEAMCKKSNMKIWRKEIEWTETSAREQVHLMPVSQHKVNMWQQNNT